MSAQRTIKSFFEAVVNELVPKSFGELFVFVCLFVCLPGFVVIVYGLLKWQTIAEWFKGKSAILN